MVGGALESKGRLKADGEPYLLHCDMLDAMLYDPATCAYFQLTDLRTSLGYKFTGIPGIAPEAALDPKVANARGRAMIRNRHAYFANCCWQLYDRIMVAMTLVSLAVVKGSS